MESFMRTQMLLGGGAMEKLKKSTVAIFGVGGVGSYVAEGLVRCGVGRFILVDDDVIVQSNLNRQIHAVTGTIGQPKVKAMAERMHSISPEADIIERQEFVLDHNINDILTGDIDYVVDALDTVTAKLAIAKRALELKIPEISAMGTGNKLDPTMLMVGDIYGTSVCPLCRVMRKELNRRGISSLKVVYSKEEPVKPAPPVDEEGGAHPKRAIPGSVSFVPSVAGLIMAGETVKDILHGSLQSRPEW